jgi:protein-disulfide isomerase
MEQTKRSKAGNARSKAHGRPRRLSVGLLLVGGVSLTLVVIALILVVGSGNQQSAVEGADYAGIPAAWQNRNVLGDPEAPITLQAWEDFRCPACAAFNQRVKPGLVENYIASGDLKLEFRHFPLQQHEPGASLAAQASECAADQGLFWSYHDRVFQETSNGPTAFIAERLIDYAVELNLDKSAFTQCLMSQTHLSTVTESLQAAQAAGFSGTPSVLVDGILIDNPFDFAVVSASIDTLLSEGH